MKNPKSGFTIVESLVAIAILTAAIMAAMSAIQSGISSYTFSKDQIIAFYLAQEGVEQIRNIRDENRLAGSSWLTGIAASSNDPCYFGNACIVSPVETSSPTRCSAVGSCPFLRQDVATGFYGYDSNDPLSIFKREIVLTSINSDEVSILVTVSWSKGAVEREFRARENILDW